MSSQTLTMEGEAIGSLSAEVAARSGQNLKACYQCRRCAAGCPVGDDAGVTPDQLIRMIILGMKEEAMNSRLVWKCVECYTCGTRCPNNIHTARITEALKYMIKEQHLPPVVPKVAHFHGAFLTSTSHFGRVNEMEFMAIYEMKNAKDELAGGGGLKAIVDEMKAQMGLGMVMMKLKRIHVGLDKIRGVGEIRRLFNKAKAVKGFKG